MKLVVPILSLIACVDSGPGPQGKKVDPTYIQSHLLSHVPVDIERFDLVLDGVTYLGNKVDKTRVPPGQAMTITHYWKVDRPIGDRWRVFSQLRGAPNTADFMNLTPTDMQAGHGPATWQAGEIIEDVQTIAIRPDWRSSEATILVGLIEVGKHGTLDRMAVEGPRAKDRAIVARKLEIDLARAPAPKGSVYVQRALGEIVIDGVASDPGWSGVQQAELVPAEGGGEPTGKAIAKLAWDDEHLYAYVSVTDNDITSPFKNQDDPLWQGDCVELFIDADNNRTGYVELQVNPHNATFDSWFETTRAKPNNVEWDSGMVTAVKMRGSADAGDSGDVGWDVEIAIPWAAVRGKNENMKVRIPPDVGDRFRLNLVRVDRKSGAKPADVWASSWNRITMSDFHALDRMLVAVFADKTGSIIPQAKDPNAGSGSTLLPPAVPTQVTAALLAMQGTFELEVLASTVRFAETDLVDSQLEAFLKLAYTRDKQMKLKLRVAPGVPDTRVAAVSSLAKSIGIANPTIVADPDAGSAPKGSGSGSAAKPGTGSATGSGSAAKPGTGSATGSGSAAKPGAASAVGSGRAREPAEEGSGSAKAVSGSGSAKAGSGSAANQRTGSGSAAPR